MSERRFNIRGGKVSACPKCGNDTQFIAVSQQVAEDCCEVGIKCICGFEHPDSRMEDVMGSLDRETVECAMNNCWNNLPIT